MRIFTRVLDNTYGRGAAGVRASLARTRGNGWVTVSVAHTHNDGSIEEWENLELGRGLYRIVFDTDSYFAGLGAMAANPEVVIIFRIPNESDAFQVQIMLAPYSYSTYFATVNDVSESS